MKKRFDKQKCLRIEYARSLSERSVNCVRKVDAEQLCAKDNEPVSTAENRV